MELMTLNAGGNSSRALYLFDEIDHQSILPIIQDIHSFNAEDEGLEPEAREPIKLYICSSGGELAPSLGLVAAIETSETPIEAHAIGEVASCALMIYVSCHHRYAYKHSSFMYHSISAGMSGPTQRARDFLVSMESNQSMYDDVILANTEFTEEFLNSVVAADKDYWFTYLEAYEKGVVDFISVDSRYEKEYAELLEKYPPEPEKPALEEMLSKVPPEELEKFLAGYQN